LTNDAVVAQAKRQNIFKIKRIIQNKSKRITKSCASKNLLVSFNQLTIDGQKKKKRRRSEMILSLRRKKVLKFMLKKQKAKMVRKEGSASNSATATALASASTNYSLYPKLQSLAISRLRDVQGRFLGKAQLSSLKLPKNDHKLAHSSKASSTAQQVAKKIKKFKKTNGIQPIFQVRRKYRKFLAGKSGELVRPLTF